MPAAWLGLRTSVVPSIPSTDTTHTRPVFLTVAVIFWLISSPWCPGRIGQSHGRSRDRPRGRARPPALPAEIGRASCRERAGRSGGAGWWGRKSGDGTAERAESGG